MPGLGYVVRITPIYKPWIGQLEGEQPLLRGAYDHHGYYPLTNWDDPQSIPGINQTIRHL